MTQYLALIDKRNGDTISGRGLVGVDERLCAHCGVDPDPVDWYRDWMNLVGLSLACGRTFAQCRDDYPELGSVIEWLEEHYDNASYAGR